MVIVEVIYEKTTRKVIAAQEFPQERLTHDWELAPDQAFVVVQGKLPAGDISQYRISMDLTSFEIDPNYISPDDRLLARQQEYDQIISDINTAVTISDLKPTLVKLLGNRPEKEVS